jgi:hypothetical protein
MRPLYQNHAWFFIKPVGTKYSTRYKREPARAFINLICLIAFQFSEAILR